MTVRWNAQPSLRRPTLVAAFSGWNDAADAASDGVRWLARTVGARVFAICRETVDHVALVKDEAIAAAQRNLWRDWRIASEPGGAAALAALVRRIRRGYGCYAVHAGAAVIFVGVVA